MLRGITTITIESTGQFCGPFPRQGGRVGEAGGSGHSGTKRSARRGVVGSHVPSRVRGYSGARVVYGAESADAFVWEWRTDWGRYGAKIKKTLLLLREAYRGPRLLSGEEVFFFYLQVFLPQIGTR